VAVLSLGAQAALIGTRLLTTKEILIHKNLKEALLNASIYDTTIIMKSLDATHRVWNNEGAQRVLELEASKSKQAEILNAVAGTKSKIMYEQGDLSSGIVSCGQSVGLCNDLLSVKELIDKIMKEAEEIVKTIYNS
jgi:nitronate monooxygenase